MRLRPRRTGFHYSVAVSVNLLKESETRPVSEPGHQERSRRLIQGVLSALLSKGAVLLCSAITVPIAIRYLGTAQFGIWVTISTLLSMLLVMDLGVANSLTNYISEAYARNDRERSSTYATTAFALMVAVSVLLGALAWVAWPHLRWQTIFHLGSSAPASEVSRAVAYALVVFLVGLPAGLAAKILGGYQEVRTANLFTGIASVLNLISVIVLVRLHAGLAVLVAASSAALVGMNLVALVWVWVFHKPWLAPRPKHISRKAMRGLMHTGIEFFLLQIAGLVVFNSDSLVISHYAGPADVASYSLAWRLVGYAAVVQTLIVPALWPAFTEAFTRGDTAWVRQTFRRTLWITMSTALAFSVIFAVAGRWLIRWWATAAAVPSQRLMLLMCAWILLSTFMNNTGTILVAAGKTSVQAWCSIVAAVFNLGLSIVWVQRYGPAGVIAATIVSYMVVLVVPQTWIALRLIHARHQALTVPA